MPGTFSSKLLASGTLPTSIANLYVVPALTQTVVKSIVLMNSASGSVVINLYAHNGVTARHLIPQDLVFASHYLLETDLVYTLTAGESIQGDCDTLSSVDFTIHGVEEV